MILALDQHLKLHSIAGISQNWDLHPLIFKLGSKRSNFCRCSKRTNIWSNSSQPTQVSFVSFRPLQCSSSENILPPAKRRAVIEMIASDIGRSLELNFKTPGKLANLFIDRDKFNSAIFDRRNS